MRCNVFSFNLILIKWSELPKLRSYVVHQTQIYMVKTKTAYKQYILAVRTGLEPVNSTVTVWNDNHFTNAPNLREKN